MLKHIVVALEGAESHSTAPPCVLDCAAEIGARTGAEIVILHVEPRDSSELESLTPFQLEGVVEATDEAELSRIAHTREEQRGLQHRVEEKWPVRVDPQVARGPVRLTTERLIRLQHGDMLVARYGEARCKAGYLATLPERVVRELDVPVLFLAAGTCQMLHGLERVLVPLDGSRYAESILPLAREFLPPESGSLHLLLVVPAHTTLNALRHGRGPLASRKNGEAYLDSVAARPELAGIRIERTVLEGVDPAEAIQSVAQSAHTSLVAMMTRDRGALERMVAGSVAHRILKELRVPLLLWRSPARARAASPTSSGE